MEPFVFYWSKFNLSGGLKYVAGIIIISLLAQWISFPWYVVGISALLTWVMILLGKPKNSSSITALYLLIGAGLIMISNLFTDTYWQWLSFIFIVTFIGTALIRFGLQWFMLGWSLIYWFLLSPVMLSLASPDELLFSHLIGVGSVLFLVFLEYAWKKLKTKTVETRKTGAETNEPVTWWNAISYALVVALVITIGLMLGHKWLSTDPTFIANAAFMIIGFSLINTWKAGLERLIGAVLAIVLGFYLGVGLQSEVFGIVITIIMSILVVGFLEVNNGAVIFFFLIIMSYGWGMIDFETGNTIANERVIAEIGGVLLAGIAITMLNYLNRYFNSLNFRTKK